MTKSEFVDKVADSRPDQEGRRRAVDAVLKSVEER